MRADQRPCFSTSQCTLINESQTLASAWICSTLTFGTSIPSKRRMPNACFKFFGAALVGILLLSVSSQASAQKVTLGVLAGASLTEDYRDASFANPGGTRYVRNASQWFMIGPTLDVGLTDNVSAEVNAIRRRIRYTELTIYPTPLELPNATVYQLGPFLQDGYTWQISALGKYRFSGARVRPFTELGFSFLPVENRDHTGITAGSGVELPIGRLSFTPTIRYTRWLTNPELGAVANQLQFLVGIRENSKSQRPTIMGHPLSLGFVIGTGITKLLKERSDPASQRGATSDPHTPIAGIRFGLPVTENFSVEVDGLFRGTHQISGALDPDGSIVRTEHSGTAFLTWEFPLLAKYKLPASKVAPVFELGPSVRITAHTQSENYSHYGATAGVGVAGRFKKMSVSPTLRYTHWAADKKRNGLEPGTRTSPNQFEVVVGFTF
jgi:hypothetical protein